MIPAFGFWEEGEVEEEEIEAEEVPLLGASPGDFAFSLTIQYTIQFFKVLGQYNTIPIQYNILKNCTQYVTIF